jgi:large repetitive protein
VSLKRSALVLGTAVVALSASMPSTAAVAISSASTHASKPGRVTHVRAKASATSPSTAVVSWRAAKDHGARITSYTVRYGHHEHRCTSPCAITGLSLGQRYRFDVRAVNRFGGGPYSAPSNAITLTATPRAVPDVTVFPGDQSARWQWKAASDQGSRVTSYQVLLTGEGTHHLPASARSFTASGLDNGQKYYLEVRACNVKGCGAYGRPGSLAVPYGEPLAPAAPAATDDPSATGGSSDVAVTWSAPGDNGRAITSYTVDEYAAASATGPFDTVTQAQQVSGTVASTTFTVNDDGMFYEYAVTATNAAGDSTPSAGSSPAVEAAGTPPQMDAPLAADHDPSSVAGYDGSLTVTFTVPPANGSAVTAVQYAFNGSTDPAGTFDAPAASGQSETESVPATNGQSYTVSVRAENDAGQWGAWSEQSNPVNPYGAPTTPTVTATVSGVFITWGWSGGDGNGRDIADYFLCINSDPCIDEGSQPGTYKNAYGEANEESAYAYIVNSAGEQGPNSAVLSTMSGCEGPCH